MPVCGKVARGRGRHSRPVYDGMWVAEPRSTSKPHGYETPDQGLKAATKPAKTVILEEPGSSAAWVWQNEEPHGPCLACAATAIRPYKIACRPWSREHDKWASPTSILGDDHLESRIPPPEADLDLSLGWDRPPIPPNMNVRTFSLTSMTGVSKLSKRMVRSAFDAYPPAPRVFTAGGRYVITWSRPPRFGATGRRRRFISSTEENDRSVSICRG